ncbi:helix-turn-helix domain-containing protein [Actinorugispora endophytica]|uniref:Helix-turn-helix protein n=1 Tax=Actinorugispora endophytica TaxID=1605990 RepID=A0A4R6UWY0_9ACTN|nr:helix-turn-helix transcriptional regulator [Actinorugispora endophytica]TDQ50786.1 helix-turn-helix protein [Actinorugispora endophytica]
MTERALHAVPEAEEPLLRHLIGDVLRRARQEQGRTLREVAEAAQVSMPYLSEIERGRKEPSSEVLAAVYRALGLHLVDLVGDVADRLSVISAPVSAPAAPGFASRGGPRAMLLAA